MFLKFSRKSDFGDPWYFRNGSHDAIANGVDTHYTQAIRFYARARPNCVRRAYVTQYHTRKIDLDWFGRTRFSNF